MKFSYQIDFFTEDNSTIIGNIFLKKNKILSENTIDTTGIKVRVYADTIITSKHKLFAPDLDVGGKEVILNGVKLIKDAVTYGSASVTDVLIINEDTNKYTLVIQDDGYASWVLCDANNRTILGVNQLNKQSHNYVTIDFKHTRDDMYDIAENIALEDVLTGSSTSVGSFTTEIMEFQVEVETFSSTVNGVGDFITEIVELEVLRESITSTVSAVSNISYDIMEFEIVEDTFSSSSSSVGSFTVEHLVFDKTDVPSYFSKTVGTTSATISYKNEDASTATIYITSNGETKSVSVASGDNDSVTFTGLSANTAYSVSAYAKASGEVASYDTSSTAYTTDKYTTAVPSWDSNTDITNSSAKVYYTNNDGSTANVYITVNSVTKSVSIGTNETGFAEFTGLSDETLYTSTAYAQASGENASASSSATGTSFATKGLKWTYIGTSGTNDGTVDFGTSGTDTCDTSSEILTSLEASFPASGYSLGFIMKADHAYEDPQFGEVPCTPYYYEAELTVW